MEIVFAKKRIKIATVALNFMYNSFKKKHQFTALDRKDVTIHQQIV